MKLRHPWLQKAIASLANLVLRFWARMIDWRAVYFDATTDPVHPAHRSRFVFAIWHEYLLMIVALRGGRRVLGLASHHADGELISKTIKQLNWGVVRGSTTRGGVAALYRCLRDDTRNLCFTPDGPRGPRRTMSAGPIYLASKLGLPLVCIGLGYERPWRLRSWDRFALPRPFCRGRIIFGPPLGVPRNLDREALERYRQWFEQLLNWLTDQAEGWAARGEAWPGEMRVCFQRASRTMRRQQVSRGWQLPEALARSWALLPGSQLENSLAA